MLLEIYTLVQKINRILKAPTFVGAFFGKYRVGGLVESRHLCYNMRNVSF